MGVSKAAFIRAEIFETELEDTGDGTGMVTSIMGWLFVSVFNILACVFSQQSIMEDTSICNYFDEGTWWDPEQFSPIYKFTIFFCRHLVWAQIVYAVSVIIVVTYLIIHRLSGRNQTMTVAFNVFLGIFCGLSGKSTVDLLGGNGKLWLFVWAMFCLEQLVTDVITLAVGALSVKRRRLVNGEIISLGGSGFDV